MQCPADCLLGVGRDVGYDQGLEWSSLEAASSQVRGSVG